MADPGIIALLSHSFDQLQRIGEKMRLVLQLQKLQGRALTLKTFFINVDFKPFDFGGHLVKRMIN